MNKKNLVNNPRSYKKGEKQLIFFYPRGNGKLKIIDFITLFFHQAGP